MNKTELVAAMAEQTNLSKKDAEAALKAFIDVVSEELKKGEKVQLVGFGTFEVSERAAREGRNRNQIDRKGGPVKTSRLFVLSIFFNYPFFNITGFRTEIYSYFKEFPFIHLERKSVMLVIYLLQCFFCRTVQFKFHDIDEFVCLQDKVDAPFACMIFHFGIEAD